MRQRLIITVVAIVTLWTAKAPGAEWNLLDAEGLFSFHVLEKNIHITLHERIGINILPSWNLSLGGQQSYRNYSVDAFLFISGGYRIELHAFVFPLGVVAGFRTLRIGSYSKTLPVLGLESGVYYRIGHGVSIRGNYRVCAHFDDNTVFSHTVLVGVGFSFLKVKK